MTGFGFAPPLQRRLAMATGPANPDSPQAQGVAPTLSPKGATSLSDSIGQLKTGLQSLGLMKTPTPGDNLPFVENPGLPPMSPDIGSSQALDSAAADGAANVASGAGDAAAAGGSLSDIGDMLAELFL